MMMLPLVIHCPYCGSANTDEYDLMNLYDEKVYFLKCGDCHKESTLILYDLSAEKVKGEDNG